MILQNKLMCTFYALEMLEIQIRVVAKRENVQTTLSQVQIMIARPI